MRITSRYLKEWLQAEFKRLEIDCNVLECYKTRFRGHEYECGAAHYIYRIGNEICPAYMYIFCSKDELEDQLSTGYKLQIKLKDGRYLSEAYVTLSQK